MHSHLRTLPAILAHIKASMKDTCGIWTAEDAYWGIYDVFDVSRLTLTLTPDTSIRTSRVRAQLVGALETSDPTIPLTLVVHFESATVKVKKYVCKAVLPINRPTDPCIGQAVYQSL
jgi:hypothetical protein